MISVQIKTSAGISGVGFNSATIFRQTQMERLGNQLIAEIWKRVDSGRGAGDVAAPPLSGKTSPILHNGKFVRQRVGYAGEKVKAGLRGVRDLIGTGKQGGHMRANFTVRLATENRVVVSFTTRSARQKMSANERRFSVLSIDGSVEAAMVVLAAQMFKAQVQAIRLLSPQRRAA